MDFQEIYETYFGDVYKYVLALSHNESVAEEITQETFFKALKGIDGFRGECKLYVWLCQIAKNTYLSYLKKQKQILPANLPEEDPVERALEEKTMALQIHRILHGLEEPYKEVFSLRTFGELPFRQIGELFGKTEGWARVTYHRAKLKIKEELK